MINFHVNEVLYFSKYLHIDQDDILGFMARLKNAVIHNFKQKFTFSELRLRCGPTWLSFDGDQQRNEGGMVNILKVLSKKAKLKSLTEFYCFVSISSEFSWLPSQTFRKYLKLLLSNFLPI